MSQEQKPIDSNTDVNTIERPEQAGAVEPEPAGAASAAEQAVLDHDTITRLQQELEQALAKAEQNRNLYVAARAEAENMRKRNERELQNARKYLLKEFIDELLPVKDSLEMGIAAARESADIDKLREGSELTLKMLAAVLEKFGIQEINPVGARFNPDQHQAMATQPSDQAEPNTVLHVIQKGYLLNERLLRPALVIVAQAMQPQASRSSFS